MSSPIIQKRRKRKSIASDYVNNDKLFDVMSKFIADRKLDPNTPIPNYVGECLMLIARKLANKGNFYAYSYKEEMIGDGIENCIRYIENFNPEKTKNPFAYFTQIIYYAFVHRINKEQRLQYIKYKNVQELNFKEQLENNSFIPNDNEVINQFISKYEERIEKKKQKLRGVDVIFEDDKPD